MKRMKIDVETIFEEISKSKLEMKKTTAEGLDVDYVTLFPRAIADRVFDQLEESVEYYEGNLTKIRVFGKWHDIPRQQVAYGDANIKYKYSGITVPAKPWIPCLNHIKKLLEDLTGYNYNFVLINRYRNGNDHMGEHKDDEAELDKNTPIASISLGQNRDFILKHGHCRKKGAAKRDISQIKLYLEHGSLLLMNSPTNESWYHSLPVRKKLNGVRINLTFRKIIQE